jgi:hypothetical protein
MDSLSHAAPLIGTAAALAAAAASLIRAYQNRPRPKKVRVVSQR